MEKIAIKERFRGLRPFTAPRCFCTRKLVRANIIFFGDFVIDSFSIAISVLTKSMFWKSRKYLTSTLNSKIPSVNDKTH